jgi:Ca2+-transporting ATPase
MIPEAGTMSKSQPGTNAVMPEASIAWHARSADESASELHTDLARGLASPEVAERLTRHGPNTLPAGKQRSALAILAHQFKSLIVGLLVGASVLALVMGDHLEAAAIGVVIVLNAVIGFMTEWKARTALDGLRKGAVRVARVLRDGKEGLIPAEGLVPGDVVMLAAGDRVPADGRIVEQAQLQADESALTGESLPVGKSDEPITQGDVALGDRLNMVHMGTAITAGRGTFLVTETGTRTEMGRIGTLIDEVGEQTTPLEGKLSQLSRALLVVVLVLCVVIVFAGWLRGHDLFLMLEVGISLAIAAVPEGLLAVTTMTLAVGMQRMARMNALVRRLPAVEALGSTTVICTDKTGTLTRNEMTVRVFEIAGKRIEVTGTGYAAEGEFTLDGQKVDLATKSGEAAALGLALRIGALCNDATLERTGASTNVLGDPTEAALVVAAEKSGLDLVALQRDYPRTAEIPFNSETKRMATAHRTPDGKVVAYVKGAPAAVMKASVSVLGAGGVTPMSEEERARGGATNDALAAEALRVLGLAYRELPAQHEDADSHPRPDLRGPGGHDRPAA